MPSLIIDKNRKGFKVIDFNDKMTIGRGPDNDVIIEDASISRNHASIQKKGDDYLLIDSSSNGTFVNEEKITEYALSHTDVFHIMDYNFSFIEDTKSDTIILKDETRHRQKLHIKETSLDETATTSMEESIEEQKKEQRELREILKHHGIIARHPSMLTVYRDIMELARINVPVLITGEPGTGKEKVAESLHVFSGATGSLVALNCAAIPEGIFESELFGSVKGAFNQASDKPGKLEQAHQGTIFLDEIGDMVLAIQPKLLRFLEDKKVTRLGDTRTKTVNVRVVAATNQDLESMIENKIFRDDLYQRLACIKIHVPPLRERKDDIFPLCEFFLKSFAKEFNLAKQRLSDKAKSLLMAHSWPGNVRELRNVLLRAAIKNSKNLIEPIHLTEASDKIKPDEIDESETFMSLEDMEKNHIVLALKRVNGNKAKASKILGISRDTLYKKIEKYNI